MEMFKLVLTLRKNLTTQSPFKLQAFFSDWMCPLSLMALNSGFSWMWWSLWSSSIWITGSSCHFGKVFFFLPYGYCTSVSLLMLVMVYNISCFLSYLHTFWDVCCAMITSIHPQNSLPSPSAPGIAHSALSPWIWLL